MGASVREALLINFNCGMVVINSFFICSCSNMRQPFKHFHVSKEQFSMWLNEGLSHSPNANMADHSVVAWNELYESEDSWASVFCFVKLPQKSLASFAI